MPFTGKTALIAFISISAISFVLISRTNSLILTPNFYKNSGDLLGYDESALLVYSNIQKWVYFFQVIYLTVKLFLIALILYTTLYLSKQTVRFTGVLCVVILAENIFILAAFLKLLWFYHFDPAGTLQDWQRTYLLSLLTIIPNVKAAWYYPLQTLNVFEIAYWLLLAYGLSKVTKLDFDRSLQIVLKGYVPALIVWMACVLFVTLVFFPAQG